MQAEGKVSYPALPFSWFFKNRVSERGKIMKEKKEKVEETKEERLERVKQYFDKKYDKLKNIKFKNRRTVNMTKHFYLPKEFANATEYLPRGQRGIVMNRRLSKSALALYPVLCSFADFTESNWFQVSIQKMCGEIVAR